MIQKDIKEQKLTRVVVAPAPRICMNRPSALPAECWLNPYLCELVSIREQTPGSTRIRLLRPKSQGHVAGVFPRVYQEPLTPLKVPSPRTLIVGGGIAGIQATLEIADAGFPVYLVEREPSIGVIWPSSIRPSPP